MIYNLCTAESQLCKPNMIRKKWRGKLQLFRIIAFGSFLSRIIKNNIFPCPRPPPSTLYFWYFQRVHSDCAIISESQDNKRHSYPDSLARSSPCSTWGAVSPECSVVCSLGSSLEGQVVQTLPLLALKEEIQPSLHVPSPT